MFPFLSNILYKGNAVVVRPKINSFAYNIKWQGISIPPHADLVCCLLPVVVIFVSTPCLIKRKQMLDITFTLKSRLPCILHTLLPLMRTLDWVETFGNWHTWRLTTHLVCLQFISHVCTYSLRDIQNVLLCSCDCGYTCTRKSGWLWCKSFSSANGKLEWVKTLSHGGSSERQSPCWQHFAHLFP